MHEIKKKKKPSSHENSLLPENEKCIFYVKKEKITK